MKFGLTNIPRSALAEMGFTPCHMCFQIFHATDPHLKSCLTAPTTDLRNVFVAINDVLENINIDPTNGLFSNINALHGIYFSDIFAFVIPTFRHLPTLPPLLKSITAIFNLVARQLDISPDDNFVKMFLLLPKWLFIAPSAEFKTPDVTQLIATRLLLFLRAEFQQLEQQSNVILNQQLTNHQYQTFASIRTCVLSFASGGIS